MRLEKPPMSPVSGVKQINLILENCVKTDDSQSVVLPGNITLPNFTKPAM